MEGYECLLAGFGLNVFEYLLLEIDKVVTVFVGGRVDCGHAWLQYVKDWFAEGRCKGANPFGAVADVSYIATDMPLLVAHHPIKIQPSNGHAIDCIIDRIT
jgi:hypothetical protein